MPTKTAAITGHLATSQSVTAVEPTPTALGDRVDDRAGEHEADGEQRGEQDHRQGDRDLQRAQLPERPALVGRVDRRWRRG